MLPALSQVCTLGASFEDDIDSYADAAGSAIELWLTKLEDYLATHSVAEVKARTADRGLALAAAAYQGGLLLSQGDARREAWALFERRLDLCAELGIPTLVITADFLGPFMQTDIERAQVSLKQAGQASASRGVRLALEFQARNTFLNNLETAAYFVGSVKEPAVGLCLDAFHFHVGPSKLEDLAYLSPANLFHVQVSDVADRPRELAGDADRIMPGDGDFPLVPIFEHLRRIGYAGYVSLELLNPMFWQIAPRSVAEIGLTALRKSLGQSTGGA
jgi:4-hydroxyphenylpyruvate dioxygenase